MFILLMNFASYKVIICMLGRSQFSSSLVKQKYEYQRSGKHYVKLIISLL